MWFGRCLLQMVFPHGSIAIISRSIAIARLHHGETVSLRLKNLSMMHWILPPAPRPCRIRYINLLNSESFSAFPAQVHFHLMSLICGVILSSCHPVTHLSSTLFFLAFADEIETGIRERLGSETGALWPSRVYAQRSCSILWRNRRNAENQTRNEI